MGRFADGNGTAAEVWRERLTRQRRSGLSIAEFCREEDVSPASFYRWRKRFGDRVGGIEGSPLFVPVQLVTGDRPTAGVQIELPGGAIVRLPVEASAELVTTAIQAATSRGPREEGVSC